MNAVSFVGYILVFLVVVIVAARWIYLNHPALRDIDQTRPGISRDHAEPPGGTGPRD